MPMQELQSNNNNEVTKDEMIELFSSDNKEEENKEKVSIDGDKDEEKKEVKVDESKEELIEEEEEKLEELATPPRRQEILKAFPDIFKKFPYLEKALYREQAYTELFATIDDAKEIAEKAKNYDEFEQSIMSGNLNEILKTVKNSDKEIFAKTIDNLLPSLAEVDSDAYHHIIGDVIKRTLITAAQSAINGGDNEESKQLGLAANIIYRFIFGPGFVAPAPFSKKTNEVNEEESKIQEERANFIREKFESVSSNLSEKVNNVLTNTVNEYIDPKSLMSDYIKRNAVKDVIGEVENLIEEDSRFQKFKDALWEKAFDEDFSSSSLSKIRSAYLSKAKTLLPSVIQKVRNEALRGNNTKQTEEKPKNRDVSRNVDSSVRDSQSNKSQSQQIPKNMKTLDFLMQD